MLLQFSVENYRSFKKKAVLSLEASADNEHINNTVEMGKNRFLKSVLIFGANASGKSNLFRALTDALLAVRMSNDRQINQPISTITPFLFSDETKAKPSKFEFVFETNGKKYIYGFSATNIKVYEEYLYAYNSIKPSVVFERKGNEYTFTSSKTQMNLKPITLRNTNNKFFLATATSWNSEETRDAYEWLAKYIDTHSTDIGDLRMNVAPMFENDDGTLRAFTNNLLKAADINISDYSFDAKEISREDFVQRLPLEMRTIFSKSQGPVKNYTIITDHIINDNGKVGIQKLDLSEESLGTQNIFFLSPVLKDALETGKTVCIDEFDNSLHPLLVKYLINLFNNPEINTTNAQLIVSLHTTYVISQENLRRDQFYFIEKDQETGISELYSLDEFSPRKTENIGKAYLLGRYGSIPHIEEVIEI